MKKDDMDLLRQWRDVYQEVERLSMILDRLPESCDCGDADAHIEQRCPCCESSHHQEPQGRGMSCIDTLATLHADLSILCEDFAKIAAPLDKAAHDEHRVELRRGVLLSARELEQVVAELDRVTDAVMGFRRTCAVSEMRRVKRHAATLRSHCDRLNRELQPGRPGEGR